MYCGFLIFHVKSCSCRERSICVCCIMDFECIITESQCKMARKKGRYLTPKAFFSNLNYYTPPWKDHIRSTYLALSFWCFKQTRPFCSSAQVKVSSLTSSRSAIPLFPSPSSHLNTTSCPLLGPRTRWKVSCSDGLSGSFTCSRVGGSGAKPPRGTSREPLTCRAGGWTFTERKREDRERKKSWNGCSFLDAYSIKVELENPKKSYSIIVC